jgi:hypothetical protein
MAVDPLIGDLQFLPEVLKGQIKGNLVRGIVRYIGETYGRETVDHVAAMLPDEAKRLMTEPPLPSLWVPFAPIIALVRGIVEGPFDGDVSGVREMTAYIARTDISSVYKVLLKMLSTPAFLINRIGSVHEMYTRGVEMRGSTPTPGRGQITLVSGVLPYYHCLYGVAGWLDAALNLYGVKQPHIEHTTCRHTGGERCTWQVSWA